MQRLHVLAPALALLVACAPVPGGLATPTAVTVQQLADSPDAYIGRRVRTAGTVRVFAAGTPDEHYVLEDTAQLRVGLRGLDRERLQPLVDRPAEVVGVFQFAPDFGRSIQVERLTAAGPG